MGTKDWFAGKVAGPCAYGNAMGPQAREGGSALANIVFMSHGTHPVEGTPIIFESETEMKAAGFVPRFPEITNIDIQRMTGEELSVFRSLQTAMTSFVFILNSNGALQTMQRDSTSKFRNRFGPSFLKSMVDCHLVKNIEDAQTQLLSYIGSFEKAQIQSILNIDKPACGDLLEFFIFRAVNLTGARLRYGFNRTGSTGFAVTAIPLALETVISIGSAAKQFNW